MKNQKTLFLVKGGVIAALYTAVTLAFAPIAYGALQVRISEALTILPLFTPAAVPGLVVGCLLSNAMGILLNTNSLGPIDLIVGTSATLIASVLTYLLRGVRFWKVPVLSFAAPVICNAILVGWELSYIFSVPFIIEALWVGLGQLIAVALLGGVLYAALIKTRAAQFLIRTEWRI